jgi:hypothetical protein
MVYLLGSSFLGGGILREVAKSEVKGKIALNRGAKKKSGFLT